MFKTARALMTTLLLAGLVPLSACAYSTANVHAVKSSYGTSVEWKGKEARLVSYFPLVGKGESVALQTFIENYVKEICFEVHYTKQIKQHVRPEMRIVETNGEIDEVKASDFLIQHAGPDKELWTYNIPEKQKKDNIDIRYFCVGGSELVDEKAAFDVTIGELRVKKKDGSDYRVNYFIQVQKNGDGRFTTEGVAGTLK